jgi:hypothetical protein
LRQWWTDGTVDGYVKKAACFVEQYSNYRLVEIDDKVRTSSNVCRQYHGDDPLDLQRKAEIIFYFWLYKELHIYTTLVG